MSKLATDLTVHVTPIADSVEWTGKARYLESTDVDENGKFTVIGDKGRFSWVVYGKRGSIDVEPLKSETNVCGDGPYRYIR